MNGTALLRKDSNGNNNNNSRKTQRRTTITTITSQASNSSDKIIAPKQSPGIPSKNGYLTKRSISSMGAFANWKERFFVLTDGVISYYKPGSTSRFFGASKDTEMAHLKGDIPLTSDTIVQNSNIDDKINCFEVITPMKKLYAQASSEAEVDEWIKAITIHIIAIKNRKIKPSLMMLSIDESRHSLSDSWSVSNIQTNNSPIDESEYIKPLALEQNDIAKALKSSNSSLNDPKDTYIKDLLDEIKNLRQKLVEKDHEIAYLMEQRRHSFTSYNIPDTSPASAFTSRSKRGNLNLATASMRAPVLDLRDVRRKQLQLWDAVENGNIRAVSLLLNEAVVDVNGKGIEDYTSLHIAASNNQPDIIRLLQSRGADLHARTREKETPLHIASRNGYIQCVETLLQGGADPNITDQSGNGSIHLAAESGHIEIAKLLLNRGAKTDVPNASGSLPMHLAPIGHPIRVLLGVNGSKLSIEKSSNISNNSQKLNDSQKSKSDDTSADKISIAFHNKYQQALALGPRDFEFVRVLGRGAFAKVYLVRGRGSNRNKWYALKAYNKQAIVQKNQARYIYTEKAALQACSDHPYIVTLHYAFQSNDRLFLVMDYCGGGDLLSALTRRKRFTESEARIYIGEIILALSHLHSKNIVFRDLKPENVVIDMEGHALLTDFGISKEGIADHSSASTFCGSPMYLAPEMLSRSGHGFPLDWYSVGALFYELITGLPPFYTNDKKQLFQNILKGSLPIPEYVSPIARSLLQGLLQRDPSKRLGSGPKGYKEIMSHPFFSTLDWKLLYERKILPPFRPQLTLKPDGTPDISNFPENFTDQVISDIEKGISNLDTNVMHPNRSSHHAGHGGDPKLFADFDFTPQLILNDEAKQFEKFALEHTESNSLGPKSMPVIVEKPGTVKSDEKSSPAKEFSL